MDAAISLLSFYILPENPSHNMPKHALGCLIEAFYQSLDLYFSQVEAFELKTAAYYLKRQFLMIVYSF